MNVYRDNAIKRNGDLLDGTREDLLNYLLPNEYKGGSCRKVFEFNNPIVHSALPVIPSKDGVGKGTKLDIAFVVKVACIYEGTILEGVESNIAEWNVWCSALGNPEVERWLCPVLNISADARFLVMARCQPIKEEDIPEMIPAFLKDTHILNWGLYTDPQTLETRPVMLDYGHIRPQYIAERFKTFDERNYTPYRSSVSDIVRNMLAED